MDTNERFSVWMERLEKSLQLYKSSPNDASNNSKSSLSLLASVLAEDDESQPEWINKFGDSAESVLEKNRSNIKNQLCRLTFPKLSLVYESLKSEVSSLSTAGSLTQIDAIQLDEKNEAILEQYFSSIENRSTDPIVGLCKLADYCRRIDRTVKLDKQQLDKLKSAEEAKFSSSSQDRELRTKKLLYLEGRDEGGLIKSSTKLLSTELQNQKVALSDAAKEEELARLAYEAAMKKTKHVQCSVDRLENVLDTMSAQIETTKKINEMQLLLDDFIAESSKRRMDLVDSIREDLDATQKSFFQRSFCVEFPTLLKHVTSIFNNLSFAVKPELGGESRDLGTAPTFPLAIRIGLEAIKVFRVLKDGVVFDVLDQQLSEFEGHLRELQKAVPIDGKADITHRKDHTTVVLHFTHLYHDTPDDHVEAQSRINTSLKLLEREVAANNAGGNSRTLEFRNCNDIIAPPLWCLPLVHSPQYLNRLWKFSVEAKTDDLYVPLEFDTEWETEDGSSSSSSEESDEENTTRRSRSNVFELDDHIAKRLGSTVSECLSTVFKHDKYEKKLAKLVTEKRTEQRRRRRSRASFGSSVSNVRKVSTPYGNGVVVEDDNGSDSIKVMFEWGAVGYMNKDSVQDIEDKSNETSFVHSVANDKDKERDNERFLFTDLRLHRLVTRILSHVKVQRAVLEKVGVKDAHMSLWLHGRTSRGLSQTIEKAIKDWLRMYDVEKLRNLLDEFDRKAGPYYHDEAALFMSQLQAIRHPSPSSNRVPLFDENEVVDLVALRIEAFEYSKKRLLNKSGVPRANNPRRNRKGKTETDEADAVSTPTTNPTTNPTPTPTPLPMRSLPPPHEFIAPSAQRGFAAKAEKLNVVVDPSVSQTLRPLVLSLMHTLQLTQLTIANELFRNYQYKTSQSAISAWFRFKASRDSERVLNNYFVSWLQHFRNRLSPKDQENLDIVLSSCKPNSSSSIKPTMVPSFQSRTEKSVSLPSHVLLQAIKTESKTTESNDVRESMNNPASIEQHTTTTQSIPSTDVSVSFGNNEIHHHGRDSDNSKMLVEEENAAEEDNMESQSVAESIASSSIISTSVTPLSSSEHKGSALLSAINTAESLETEKTVDKDEEGNQDDMDLESVEESAREENNENDQDYGLKVQSTIERLTAEMERRNISQTFVSKEAATLSISISQPELSLFINHRVIPYSQRDKGFFETLDKWISFSIKQPKREGGRFGKPRPPKRKSPEESLLDKHVKDLADGIESVIDKPVVSNMSKFPFCEVCKEEEDLYPCNGCPCQYHMSCIEDEKSSNMKNWYCSHCRENGVTEAESFSDDGEKLRYCQTTRALLYFFSSKDRMWRKASVVAPHPEQDHVILVKCLPRDDDDSDDAYCWIDSSKLLLLKLQSKSEEEEDDDELDYFHRCSTRSKRARQSSASVNDDFHHSARKRGRPAAKRDYENNRSVTPTITTSNANIGEGMSDTYLGANSLKAALCAAGTCCRAVDIVLASNNTNAFCAIRPPGHHAGRNGCTAGCLSTGFCLLNNAAIAVAYARIRYGITRIAVVDIDVHFGNGTAEILQHDPDTFFASVHMIYGEKNDGNFGSEENQKEYGFYPANQGATTVTDNYVSIGVYPPNKELRGKQRRKKDDDGDENDGSDSSDIDSVDSDEPMEMMEEDQPSSANFRGSIGYLNAIKNVIIPKMEAFAPQLLIISAGFDGYFSDPLGGELNLSLQDYVICTKMLMDSMDSLALKSKDPYCGRVISLLEGGYDTSSNTLGLAKCVAAHVSTLRQKTNHSTEMSIA